MLKNKIFILATVVFVLFGTIILYASSGGITGRTLKNTTNGCSCHGTTATPDVTVSITGPDSVVIGSTAQYTLTISRASKTGAGLDIATRSGTLAPVSGLIHLSNSELTHNDNIAMTNGTVSVTFNYTAPGAVGTDTIFATGLATNSDGNTSGDDWNWAPGKRVVVKNPNAIINLSTIASTFSLGQNYPNPFNPVTKFRFSIPKSEFVSIKIFDISGREINTLVSGQLNSGEYLVDWNSTNSRGELVSSGVYIYKISAGDFTDVRKMILTK